MIILDTNVYVDMNVDEALTMRVAEFVESYREEIGLSSVVLAELLVGVEPSARARLVRWVTDGITDAAVLAPTHEDWVAAGDALRQLGGDRATWGRSFWNDLLIAASCARTGTTLLTRNVDDFRRIQRVIPVLVRPRPA